MSRWPAFTLAVALGVLASCTDRTTAEDEPGAGSSDTGPTDPGDDGSPDDGVPDDGGGSTGGSDGGGTTTGSDEGGTTGDGSSDDDDGGGAFISEPDDGVVASCDPGLQDCPDPNEKCTAYVTEPGYCCVDANKCVPIIGDKGFGEVCERTEENDDCAKGFFCMTKTSGSTGQGFCLEFCVPNDPDSCEFGGECQPFNDGVLPLCEEQCDPVLQDCSNGSPCVWTADGFRCVEPWNLPNAGYGDYCLAFESCFPGLVCVSADTYGPDCTFDACCTQFCHLDEGAAGNPLCAGSHECVAWFWPDQVPEGLENLGACMIPQ